MMASPNKFVFAPKCKARNVQHMVRTKAEKKFEKQDEYSESESHLLITPDSLRRGFSVGQIVTALGCLCDVCGEETRTTTQEQDRALAENMADRYDRQALFAALSFIGGIFATRQLYHHNFYTIEQTISGMHDRADLRRALFRRFKHGWNQAMCPHSTRHDRRRSSEDDVLCLEEHFLSQLRSVAWMFRVPSFQVNDWREFGERQSMPFIHQTRLRINNSESGRDFFKFQLHESFCDDKLKGRLLFRKQFSIDSEHVLRRVHEERAILEFLKELANPNIAEVLFAFREEHPPNFSLVFEFHPTDLRKILYPQHIAAPAFKPPLRSFDNFPGSELNHWLWIGLLGVFDAVAAVHEPLVKSVPHSAFKFIGGHFDIKPANIVIDANGHLLLTDFGQAFLKEVKSSDDTDFTITPGTYNYRPPPSYSKERAESANEPNLKRKWTREYDVWSLACVSLEVLAYILEGRDGPDHFYMERQNEDRQDLANFWTVTGDREVLKDTARRRLLQYQRRGDDYLTRVSNQILNMFEMDRPEPITVKACQRELSASVKVDRYLFRGAGDEMIADDGTYACLATMRTSFSTGRVSPLRCSLYMWRNTNHSSLTLTLEFPGSDCQLIVVPNSTTVATDEFIPLAFFDPNILFDQDQNTLRLAGPFLQCSFRNLHNTITFHFAKRKDFYHFFGALTHQHIEPNSEFRFRSCTLESASFTSPKRWTATAGHAQIWRHLRQTDFQGLYQRRSIPVLSLPQPSGASSSSNSDATSRASSSSFGVRKQRGGEAESATVYYRLALYLCGEEPCLAVVSLNHDSFHVSFDDAGGGRPSMYLERRRKADIWGQVFECPSLGSMQSSESSSSSSAQYPGVPMDPQKISDLLGNGKDMKRVRVQFWNSGDLHKFRSLYTRMVKGHTT